MGKGHLQSDPNRNPAFRRAWEARSADVRLKAERETARDRRRERRTGEETPQGRNTTGRY
jgi:hypothetical protein